MNTPSPSELTEAIVEKAKGLGASVVGVADVGTLKGSPSHRIYPKIGMDPEVPWQDAPEEALHHEVEWPADAVSALVIVRIAVCDSLGITDRVNRLPDGLLRGN